MSQSNGIFQLPLDLGHRTATRRDDFLVTSSNQEAVAWIDRWPDWHSPVLVIHGPTACGKSHLSDVWALQASADVWAIDDVILDKEMVDKTALVIDRADLLIGDVDAETKLFHLYNMAKEHKGSILMTMARPPSQLDFCIPDLSSRLRSAQAVGIQAPDDVLLSAIIVKLFNDRQMKISPEVLNYILPRMDRSFDAARTLVERADAMAMSKKKGISIPLIRDLLNV